jgi:phospholipid transport system substrate-binding protein
MSHSTRISDPLSKIVGMFLGILLALAAVPGRAQSLPADGAEAVRGFYAALLSTMKDAAALGAQGRYARLEPVVRRTFDVPLMTRLAIGPSWEALPPSQRQQVSEAFGRYISATYADRFDGYSGEKLEVLGEQPSGVGIVVRTRIVKSNDEPIGISYLTHRGSDAWQVVDIYLNGTISELATHRAEFSAILRDRGIDGLITALNRKADLLSTAVARAG